MCDEEMTGTGPVYGPSGQARHEQYWADRNAKAAVVTVSDARVPVARQLATFAGIDYDRSIILTKHFFLARADLVLAVAEAHLKRLLTP